MPPELVPDFQTVMSVVLMLTMDLARRLLIAKIAKVSTLLPFLAVLAHVRKLVCSFVKQSLS